MWDGRPYHSLDYEMKKRYGRKLYKLALDGGMTCPNRDGTLGTRGCIFCSSGGSGEFAAPLSATGRPGKPESFDIVGQIAAAKRLVQQKLPGSPVSNGEARYIAYFQSYTNTYAPLEYLETLFTQAIRHPEIAILSVATRPDCLPQSVIDLLQRLNRVKPIWVELGLQTIHEPTAAYIRRGYPLAVFENALDCLKDAGLPVITHVILGLPGETPDMMQTTVDYLGRRAVDGVKLQLLHVLKGSDLAIDYERGLVPTMSLEEYADLIVDCVSLLPPETVIHRISGDGPKNLLLAPAWSGNKKLVLNTIHRRFKERKACQGVRSGWITPLSSMDA